MNLMVPNPQVPMKDAIQESSQQPVMYFQNALRNEGGTVFITIFSHFVFHVLFNYEASKSEALYVGSLTTTVCLPKTIDTNTYELTMILWSKLDHWVGFWLSLI